MARVEGWATNAALPAADGKAIEAQRVETKYVVVQVPYVLPDYSESLEEIDAVRMLPAAEASMT